MSTEDPICSRRGFGAILPALLAAHANAQPAASDVLPSHCYDYGALPVKVAAETHTESRQVFRGATHGEFEIACHITMLAPGHASHPPHKHTNEEMLFVHQGSIEMSIDGQVHSAGPGSVVYIASNALHGARNAGSIPAQYFVLELDGQKA